MIGKLSIANQIIKLEKYTEFFINLTDYETYINPIDEGYDAEDATFNSFLNKIHTPQFN